MNEKNPSASSAAQLPVDTIILRSNELAQIAGTTPRALRHYHKIGILPEVARDHNGYRRYTVPDLIRVLRIRQLAMSGMPLRKIGNVLDRNSMSQVKLLAELDQELREQADQIRIQRELLAELSRETTALTRLSKDGRSTETQQLEQNVWTLIASANGIEPATVAVLRKALYDKAVAECAAALYPEFERLGNLSQINPAQAERLAAQIADFADALVNISGLQPAQKEEPIMALVEQMHSDMLSPAQQTVWDRFLSIIEHRWAHKSHKGD